MENNELYHYGVPGMKWGVTKTRVRSSDSLKTKSLKKKRIYELSNQELKDANNRLQLETQYRELRRKENVGRRAVNEFTATATVITGIVAAAAVYKKYGEKAVKSIGHLAIRKG